MLVLLVAKVKGAVMGAKEGGFWILLMMTPNSEPEVTALVMLTVTVFEDLVHVTLTDARVVQEIALVIARTLGKVMIRL